MPTSSTGRRATSQIPRDVLERIFGDTVAASGFERYLARRAGVVAGGANFRVQDARRAVERRGHVAGSSPAWGAKRIAAVPPGRSGTARL